jgi:hypothetical protein
MPGAYHQVGCTHENAQAYMTAGHRVSKKGDAQNNFACESTTESSLTGRGDYVCRG